MHEVDYIVVGLGIAGLTICEQLEKNNHSFIVFDKGKITSTLVSAGVINPVVLKRFTPVWNAKKHIVYSNTFYLSLTKKLNKPFLQKMPMFRIFKSPEEQNNWVVASDKNEMESFLNPRIIANNNSCIDAPFGYGEVNLTGRIDPSFLISSYKEYLKNTNKLIEEVFAYDLLFEENNTLFYKNISSKKIIFSEGISAINNPLFPKKSPIKKELLIIPNKGEYIFVKAPELKLKEMLKSSLFVIPMGDSIYKVGATYDREDTNIAITEHAREEMVSKLKKTINCPFEVVNQVAGIRPTTRDRRPLLGTLNDSDNIVFFNGMGTRGITSAPYLSEKLYNYLEKGESLPKEMDIKRYYKW